MVMGNEHLRVVGEDSRLEFGRGVSLTLLIRSTRYILPGMPSLHGRINRRCEAKSVEQE
jgi:hypothetical protein